MVALGIPAGARPVAAVRLRWMGERRGGVGRLAVAPDRQGEGFGTLAKRPDRN